MGFYARLPVRHSIATIFILAFLGCSQTVHEPMPERHLLRCGLRNRMPDARPIRRVLTVQKNEWVTMWLWRGMVLRWSHLRVHRRYTGERLRLWSPRRGPGRACGDCMDGTWRVERMLRCEGNITRRLRWMFRHRCSTRHATRLLWSACRDGNNTLTCEDPGELACSVTRIIAMGDTGEGNDAQHRVSRRSRDAIELVVALALSRLRQYL